MTDITRPAYLFTAGLSGLLFGAGLYISQMVDPLKVLRFLDFGAIPRGRWDPSLAVVIAAAIGMMFIGTRIANRRKAPVFNGTFHKPDLTRIDAPLVIGAVVFGIGWGMSGICPGPAITLIAFMPDQLILFLIAMLAGSFGGSYILRAIQIN